MTKTLITLTGERITSDADPIPLPECFQGDARLLGSPPCIIHKGRCFIRSDNTLANPLWMELEPPKAIREANATPTPAQSKPKPAPEAVAEGKTSVLYLECFPQDKSAWTRTARRQDLKLVEWVTKTLNAASQQVRNQIYDRRNER